MYRTVTGWLNKLGEDAKTLPYAVHKLRDAHNWPTALSSTGQKINIVFSFVLAEQG